MDHAEVLDRLEAAFVGPGKLAALEADTSPEGAALREHLESCVACAQEYRAWRAAARALDLVTPDSVHAPTEARARILAAVAGSARATQRGSVPAAQPAATPISLPVAAVPAAQPAAMPAATSASQAVSAEAGVPHVDDAPTPFRRPAAPRPAWIGLAAAAAVIVFLAGAFLAGPLGLSPAGEAPDGVPVVVTAAMDRILQQPDHREITLADAAGHASGTLLLDPGAHQIVVLSSALAAAPTGKTYDCYLDRNGQRTWVGQMDSTDGFAYWAGPLADPAGAGQSGDRFEVVLGDASAAPMLSGQF